jgi:hypothetical protein
MSVRLAIAAAIFFALAAPSRSADEGQIFEADYTISFLGLRVANSRFVTRVEPDHYNVDGAIVSSGMATFFDRTEARARVSGHVGAGGELRPARYEVDYRYGEKQKRTQLSFSGGRVVDVFNSPPLRAPRKDWVPVRAAQLRAVLDPISATLIRARNPRSVCPRTVKAFDGQLRADMKLSFVGIEQTTIGSFSGEVVTCRGRFAPVAGYHKSNKSLRFLAGDDNISVQFARLGRTNLFAPVVAEVRTRLGPVSIRATRIDVK